MSEATPLEHRKRQIADGLMAQIPDLTRQEAKRMAHQQALVQLSLERTAQQFREMAGRLRPEIEKFKENFLRVTESGRR